MNALLVITPQPAYLEEAKKWIERLDSGGAATGARFYVYNLQNQRAEQLGPLLQQAFTGRASQPAARRPRRRVAPGTPAGTIVIAADVPDAAGDHRRTAGTGRRRRPQPPARPPARGRGARRAATASASCATSRSSPTRTRTPS